MNAQLNPARQGGYTLFEMLVALSLTGFLSIALLANVSMGARVWETVEDRSRQTVNGNVLEKVLRRHIELAVPLSVIAGDGSIAGSGPIYFEGSGQSLRFFTEAGAGAQPPGIYGVEFVVSGGPDSQSDPVLTIRRARIAIGSFDENQNVIWDESRLPLGGASAVFAYYGGTASDRQANWQQEWSGQPGLPDLVRLSLGSDQSAEIILVAPALDYSSARMSAGKFEQYFANIRS